MYLPSVERFKCHGKGFLIGFDNTEWSNFSSPTVTTIVQPAYDEGHQAAKILIDSLEGKHEEAPNQILKCNVNWCESTN